MLSQLAAGGINQVLCDSTGRELLETCILFPSDFIPRAFSLADFALCSFIVLIPSHESCESVDHQIWGDLDDP